MGPGMRYLLHIMLLLALGTPSLAWSGPVEPGRETVSHGSPGSSTVAPPITSSRGGSGEAALLCETAITFAEDAARLPPRLLHAISLTESGRADPATGRLRPWPWTINAEGEGQFFETRQQAVAAVRALQARGVRSIDVGCLQVNLMYHANAFASLEEAFDPRANAAYAARFLTALAVDGQDWARAIAAYHSQTPGLGAAYRTVVMARWQKPDAAAAAVRVTYGDFAGSGRAYGAFALPSVVYGAFAPRAVGR